MSRPMVKKKPKRNVTVCMDEAAVRNLQQLVVDKPLTVSGLLNMAAKALTRGDLIALISKDDFERGVHDYDD